MHTSFVLTYLLTRFTVPGNGFVNKKVRISVTPSTVFVKLMVKQITSFVIRKLLVLFDSLMIDNGMLLRKIVSSSGCAHAQHF